MPGIIDRIRAGLGTGFGWSYLSPPYLQPRSYRESKTETATVTKTTERVRFLTGKRKPLSKIRALGNRNRRRASQRRVLESDRRTHKMQRRFKGFGRSEEFGRRFRGEVSEQ